MDTTFKVTSKVDIKPDELFQVLSVSPAQSVKVESIGEKEFCVTAKEPLKPGTVYKLAVATVAVQDDGTERNRDFSWAVQTADIFRVLSSVGRRNRWRSDRHGYRGHTLANRLGRSERVRGI